MENALELRFGSVLRDSRKERRLSQKSVAEAVGLSRQQIINYEKGVHEPSIVVAIRLARCLNFSLDALK